MKDLSLINALPPAQRQALLDGPAMKPPSGLSHFEHPTNKNSVGYGVIITGTILCTLLVILRLYSKAFYHKSFSVEDACAVAALGVFAGFTYSVWKLLIHPGVFVHQYDIRVKDIPHYLYHLTLGSTLYGVVIALLKTGILLEWARIFVPRGLQNRFWWACHIILVINALFYVICTFVEIFGCNPRQKQWIIWLPGTCMNVPILNVLSSSLNFVLDIIVLVLPQNVIWTLNSSKQRKIGVSVLFAVGIFACISAGVRIHSAVNFLTKEDVIYHSADMGMWCIAEMVSGFFILCLPSIPKLFKDSPWLYAILTSFKSSSQKPTDVSRQVPTIGQWRKPLPHRGSLSTDDGAADTLPLTNISVTSAVTIKSKVLGTGESALGRNAV